ncbi:MAG TPA: bifunctional precorrin-2 dehydrogenase/sirohydrochlorin ferrochelatase [Bryobacteraceae bacterium]|nr:bifunctional precorrin-2 dehydrogenase/sirohydrochlorin ferrochelatase [Bryobacteraceae bacterium]
MTHYPIFLDLRGRPVLVVGAGTVALRKARGLVEAGAVVTVVAPMWLPEFDGLPVRRVERRFRPADLDGAALVFAATNDRAVNRRVGAGARRRGIFANIADAAAECDFIVPARLERDGTQIAVSTGGRSPRLAAELRRKLESLLS